MDLNKRLNLNLFYLWSKHGANIISYKNKTLPGLKRHQICLWLGGFKYRTPVAGRYSDPPTPNVAKMFWNNSEMMQQYFSNLYASQNYNDWKQITYIDRVPRYSGNNQNYQLCCNQCPHIMIITKISIYSCRLYGMTCNLVIRSCDSTSKGEKNKFSKKIKHTKGELNANIMCVP